MNRLEFAIGLLGRAADHLERIRAALDRHPTFEIWHPGEPRSLAEVVASCHAVVVGPDAAYHGFGVLDIRSFDELRLVVLPFAGHDWLPENRLPPGCMACNIYEHEGAIAEYVMAAMLREEVRLETMDTRFRGGDWSEWGAAGQQLHGELVGKQLGIVGYGRIGKAIARRALAFGMQVAATSGSANKAAPELAWHGGPEHLDELVETSDYVVLACDLNERTRGLLSARRIGLMRPSAVLINVARAPIVDEEALFAALQQQRIGGAVLDVWSRYPSQREPAPRPSDLPFWTLDNVTMTPHCSSATAGKETRRWDAVARALAAAAKGAMPDNVFAIGPASSNGSEPCTSILH